MTPIINGKSDFKVTIFSVSVVLVCFGLCYYSGWERWYSPLPYHAMQADALLHGRLALSHDIRAMDYDLAWYNGGVQQVWGLGVPIWRLPFDLVCRVLGIHSCPDVVPLVAAVALWACYVVRTALAIRKFTRSPCGGMLTAYLFLFSPVFWNWAIGYRLIYEETCFYATLLSTALLLGMIRFVLLTRGSDFYIVCSLASLSGLVRPTHGLYGVSALMVCGLYELFRPVGHFRDPSRGQLARFLRRRGRFLTGMSVGVLGFVLLVYTNYERFGSPLEFGHRLTVSSANIVYATRFGNPMYQATTVSAGVELASWLFLSPLHNGNWGKNGREPIPFQAPTVRWRNSYMDTYDPSWLVWFLLSGIITAGFLMRRFRRSGLPDCLARMPNRLTCVLIALWFWFIVASAGLASFYWRFPTLSSRYILDFGPAFMAPLIALVLLKSRRWPRCTGSIGIGWLTAQIGMLLFLPNAAPNGHQGLKTVDEIMQLHLVAGASIESFHGQYSKEHHPSATGIYMNGNGWREDGACQGIVQIMVDQPQFIEITVSAPSYEFPRTTLNQVFRAKIGNTELGLRSLTACEESGNAAMRVRFSITPDLLRQKCDQVVTLCFAKSMTWDDLTGERQLYNVRWRSFPFQK